MGLNSLFYKYLGIILITTDKIFIKDYEPATIKKKFNKLEEYFRNKETALEIVSPDGLFVIENGKLCKLKTVDKDIVVKEFEEHILLFDYSYFERELVLSQIPYDHVNIDVVKLYYGEEIIGKKLFLRLVVEGFYETVNTPFETQPDGDKYKNFIPTNFYFLTNESFDNILVKKELNVFLSILK
jgi:hypothetical protein